MEAGSVDELLGATVERPTLQQFQVEVGRTTEDRAGPAVSGDGGEDRPLQTVDQAPAVSAQFSDRLACEHLRDECGAAQSQT